MNAIVQPWLKITPKKEVFIKQCLKEKKTLWECNEKLILQQALRAKRVNFHFERLQPTSEGRGLSAHSASNPNFLLMHVLGTTDTEPTWVNPCLPHERHIGSTWLLLSACSSLGCYRQLGEWISMSLSVYLWLQLCLNSICSPHSLLICPANKLF